MWLIRGRRWQSVVLYNIRTELKHVDVTTGSGSDSTCISSSSWRWIVNAWLHEWSYAIDDVFKYFSWMFMHVIAFIEWPKKGEREGRKEEVIKCLSAYFNKKLSLANKWSTSTASILCHNGLSASRNLTSIDKNISHCVIYRRGRRRKERGMERRREGEWEEEGEEKREWHFLLKLTNIMKYSLINILNNLNNLMCKPNVGLSWWRREDEEEGERRCLCFELGENNLITSGHTLSVSNTLNSFSYNYVSVN